MFDKGISKEMLYKSISNKRHMEAYDSFRVVYDRNFGDLTGRLGSIDSEIRAYLFVGNFFSFRSIIKSLREDLQDA